MVSNVHENELLVKDERKKENVGKATLYMGRWSGLPRFSTETPSRYVIILLGGVALYEFRKSTW